MQHKSGVAQALVLAFSALLVIPSNALLAREQGGNKKPSLSLKASPSVSFAPARIVVVAEVKGGADDLEEFYCPTRRMGMGRSDLIDRGSRLRALRAGQERDQAALHSRAPLQESGRVQDHPALEEGATRSSPAQTPRSKSVPGSETRRPAPAAPD